MASPIDISGRVFRTEDPETNADSIKIFNDLVSLPGSSLRVQSMALDPLVMAVNMGRTVTAGTAATSLVVHNAACALYHADVVLDDTVSDPRWLFVHNLTTAPTNGAVPVWRARVGGGFASIDFGAHGLYLLTGCTLALSTTPGTLTLPGSNEGYFQGGFGV